MKLFNVSTNQNLLVNMELFGRSFEGEEPGLVTTVPVEFTQVNGSSTYVPVGNNTAIRGRGRSVAVKFSSSSDGYQWRLGDTRLDLRPDGRR